jgi:molybdenum cofactor biosynthesis enzyme MoaA
MPAPPHAPYVQIEVTTVCNFSCYYCAGRDMAQRHMDMAVFMRIMDALPLHAGITVSLQGEGEPTLHPELWDMVVACIERGHSTYTITNGSRIEADLFNEGLNAVGVSIDTLDAAEAERIGRHNLAKVLANFETLLHTMGPDRVTVHTVDYGQELAPLVNWLRGLGVQRHIVQPLQIKDDYARRYGQQPVVVHRQALALSDYRCAFLDTPRMRYFNIDGVEMPCCFIKDASVFTSISDLRQTLAHRQVPAACAGCRELR